MKTWFSRLGISVPPSGTAVIMQRRFADGDGFAASFRMAGGVLHRGLNQHASRALAERTPGEISGQRQIEMIGPVAIRLALDRRRLQIPQHPCRKL